MSYQGVLRPAGSASGNQTAGMRLLTVTIYGDANGTVKLWQGAMNTPIDSSGVFNCMLGTADNPLPSPAVMDQPLWLGVAVDGGTELRPLSQMTASPFALNVADSSITASKMNMNYISTISVNGTPVTGKGTNLNIVAGNGLNAMWIPDQSTLTLSGTSGSGNMKPLWVGDGSGGNYAPPPFNTVAGGYYDTAWAADSSGYASVLGGQQNQARAKYSSVVGGYENYVEGYYSTIAGGSQNFVSMYSSFIGAGQNDTIKIADGLSSAIVGGDSNYILPEDYANQQEHFIGAGESNRIEPDHDNELFASSIVGGTNNTIYEGPSFIGGGSNNTISQEYSGIVSGIGNTDSSDFGFIGAGANNSVLGADLPFPPFHDGGASAIVGGEQNTTSESFDFVGGGYLNTLSGDFSAIPGGLYLSLGGYSFGFNAQHFSTADTGADNPAITNLQNLSQIAYFGNVTMMLGNVDNTARALQFYSPNKSHDYASDSAFYSSFQAGVQDTNIIYTLPLNVPSSPGLILGVSSLSGTNVGLAWMSGAGGDSAGWLLHGNAGAPPPGFYLGTQDNNAFEIHVHNNTHDTTGGNQRVMQYSEGSTSPNILGGSSFNVLAAGLSGAAIFSGGSKLAPNIITDSFSTIGGGLGNLIQGPYCVIAGGDSNKINTVTADHNTIGGGEGNIENNPSLGVIAGGWQNLLDTNAWASAICGGWNNVVESALSFIGGGWGNKILDYGWPYDGVLVGGRSNQMVGSPEAFIGSGDSNYVQGIRSALVGGDSNTVTAAYAFLGGGVHNKLDWGSDTSVISGGAYNYVSNRYSFVGGGLYDTINGSRSIIVGGCFNKIGETEWGTIVGGCGNTAVDTFTTIGGGQHNYAGSNLATIGGGDTNVVLGFAGTIGGGQKNQIAELTGNSTQAVFATIAGGFSNSIRPLDSLYYPTIPGFYFLPLAATVTGGYSNTAMGHFSTADGGVFNAALGIYATTLGGTGLVAMDFQTVVGRYNDTIASGLHNTDTASYYVPYRGLLGTGYDTLLPPDDPIFVVGNGSVYGRSNAFTIADNGHSTVYQTLPVNGTDPTTWPSVGSTYTNNTIVVQADVPAIGSPGGPPPMSIGVDSVIETTPTSGVYVVFVRTQRPGTEIRDTLSNAIITVTVVDNSPDLAAGMCGYATCSEIGHPHPSQFIVRTYPGAGGSTCTGGPLPFFFHLTGKE